jgi:peptidoglycan/LPS O-acetylase OafA/YrhL
MELVIGPISSAGFKRRDIQGLRAIAALAVVVFHASDLLPGGFLGVDVFFVISGFLVAHIAGSEIAATGGFRPLNFIDRRLRRVIPPMTVVVLVTLAVGLMIDTPARMIEKLPTVGISALMSVVNIYFLHNATDYFQSFQSSPLLHLWSLSVEVQFYILFASVVAAATWARSRLSKSWGTRTAAILVGAVTAFSLISALTIGSWHKAAGITLPETFSFFMLPTRLWEFGFGILACLAEQPLRRWIDNTLVIVLLQAAALVALLFGLKVGSDAWLVPGYQALAPCLGAALLIATGERGVVARLLASPMPTYFGDRSYSIYLWQGPLISFAAILFATPRAIALAALSAILVAVATYSTIEVMFRYPNREANGVAPRHSVKFAAAFAAATLVCTSVYYLVPITVARLQAPAPLRATFLDAKCDRQSGSIGIKPCVYGPPEAPKVLLIGDSHAGAISQALIDAALRTGWQAHVATASACSVPEYPEDVAFRSSCSGYSANVLAYARKIGARFVVVQQFSEYYVYNLRIGLERWKQGLTRFQSDLRSAGISTLVINDNPRFPLAVGRPLWAETWQIDQSEAMSRRAALDKNERAATTSIPGNRFIRSIDYLCRGAVCPVFDRGAWLYTDADHLSDRGAEPLSVAIEKVLGEAVNRRWIETLTQPAQPRTSSASAPPTSPARNSASRPLIPKSSR